MSNLIQEIISSSNKIKDFKECGFLKEVEHEERRLKSLLDMVSIADWSPIVLVDNQDDSIVTFGFEIQDPLISHKAEIQLYTSFMGGVRGVVTADVDQKTKNAILRQFICVLTQAM